VTGEIWVTVPEIIPGQRVEVSIVVLESETGKVISHGRNSVSGKSSAEFTFRVPMEN